MQSTFQASKSEKIVEKSTNFPFPIEADKKKNNLIVRSQSGWWFCSFFSASCKTSNLCRMLPWTHSPGSCPEFLLVDFCFLSTVALEGSKYPSMSNSTCTHAEAGPGHWAVCGQSHIWAQLTSLVGARKWAEHAPKTWALGTGIKHCRWCFINWLWRDTQDERYLRGLGKCWYGKGQGFSVWSWWLFLLGRLFGKLMAKSFVQQSIGWLCAIIPRGSLRRNAFCARGTVNVTALPSGLGISSPALLVCSAQRAQPGGDIKAPAVLPSLLDTWDPRLGVGEHRVHPWPQVLSSLLYLHYCNSTKIEASFHQHQANQDNTYLNFIYSLNRQDRQRVAVETKALERWCDMTRSHSRRWREPGIDRGFLTPSPSDLSIGAR